MSDVTQILAVFQDDGDDLGVDLVILHAVDDGTACFLQFIGKVEVVFLIETGAELDDDRHLLSVFGGAAQKFCNARMMREAVDGDHDGAHPRISRALLQKIDDGIHAVIGIGQKDIP